jgi:hypothetical protein
MAFTSLIFAKLMITLHIFVDFYPMSYKPDEHCRKYGHKFIYYLK